MTSVFRFSRSWLCLSMPSQRDTWVQNIRNRPEESNGRYAVYLQTVLAVDTWKVTPIDGTSVRGVWTFPISKFNKEEKVWAFPANFTKSLSPRWNIWLKSFFWMTIDGGWWWWTTAAWRRERRGSFWFPYLSRSWAHATLRPTNPQRPISPSAWSTKIRFPALGFDLSDLLGLQTKTKHQEATHSFSWETYVKGFTNFVTAEDALNPGFITLCTTMMANRSYSANNVLSNQMAVWCTPCFPTQ